MKSHHRIGTVVVCLAAFVASAWAQTGAPASSNFARRAGDREITLGGSGASNRDFDDSYGGLTLSLGQYINETQAVAIRQSLNYTNPDNGDNDWVASTRLAYDFHFPMAGPALPFVGANIGGLYGDGVRDTFAAGIEAGVKYYVQPRTFVYAMAEYGWFFRHANSIDNRFSDGAYTWAVGMGFNF